MDKDANRYLKDPSNLAVCSDLLVLCLKSDGKPRSSLCHRDAWLFLDGSQFYKRH